MYYLNQMLKHRECGGIKDNAFIFSVETYATYINITGWKTAANTSDWLIQYNENNVNINVHISSTTLTKGLDAYPISVPTELYPPQWVSAFNHDGNSFLMISDTDGILRRKSLTGSAYNGAVYCNMQWKRK